jgi:regulator of RNase E activity RraA
MTPEEYAAYSSEWYAKRCPYPYMQDLKPGDFLVIDMSGLEVGLWGSNVGLAAVKAGVSGVVLDGGCRDTAEIERQRCKVWCRHIARTTVIGRLEFAGMNEIVNIGGVKVSPGDVVVADDDGVIVVPAEAAELVARVARRELEADKKARRQLYQELGMPLDETVSD